MIEQAAIPSGTGEPILINAVVVGAGCIIAWGAVTLLQVRDGVRSLTSAVFGDPAASKPEGMKNDIGEMKQAEATNRREIESHIAEEMAWREDNARNVNAHNNRLHTQLARIERKLGVHEDAA